MLSIANAIDRGEINGQIACVISNRKDAKGISKAASRGLHTRIVDRNGYPNKTSFAEALLLQVQQEKPDLIVLAGFMHILGQQFVQCFENKIINIHPSLLPAYKGLDTHRRALRAKEAYHGCSVHFVTEALDSGTLIDQAKVPVLPGDTPAKLARRVLQKEHVIYPACIASLCKS